MVNVGHSDSSWAVSHIVVLRREVYWTDRYRWRAVFCGIADGRRYHIDLPVWGNRRRQKDRPPVVDILGTSRNRVNLAHVTGVPRRHIATI